MGAAGIALLGPLSINGDSALLAPRDRIVLAALAIHLGEPVSAECLADALWGERQPASWHKVVPGCILRLRRVLGAQAIETTPYGYRLVVAPEDVDVQRFERLVDRGRELLALGEPERAQHILGEALGLWHGRALADLDGWEPGRIEGGRLVELREEAQESRLDAALRAGRHAEVLAQAQSRVTEEPLREHRWAILALAQYRSGRQAEALRTLSRARTVLVDELGLDPGPELIDLEAAILRQDPALAVPAVGPDADAVCPYLGLFCYDVADAETFFGRDAEIAACMDRLGTAGVLAVVGPSGSGKSSLIRAGVGAELQRAGRRPFVVTAGSRPTIVLTETPSVATVLIVDQFEEVFTMCTDPQERARFFDGLVAEANSCPVVLCLRADHLGGLAAHPELARLIERGLYLLGPMDEAGLRAAITGPAESAGLLLEPGLVDLLVREVEGQPGALPLLSHALRRTWERREGRTLTVDGYQATGGIRGCVAQSAEQLYETLTTRQRTLLRQVLLRLVSSATGAEPVRTPMPRRFLLTDPEREQIVERLVAARLVTADEETVQIAHESLARAWPRLANWLEDDIEGQRILRHLCASADAWDAMGRPDSELYRGVRLSQVLEWQETVQPDLTATESDFVVAGGAVRDADRRAVEQQSRRLKLTRRRTRLLVAGVAALLVAALVSGLLVVRQQRQREAADLAAAVAEASRVDNASSNTPAVDQALLLAVEANRLHDSPDSRAVLADLLSGHPALIRSVATQQPVQGLAASPDGTTLLVGEGNSGTTAYDTGSLEPAPTRTSVPGWTMEYRGDGQQVLLAGRGSDGLGEDVGEVPAAVTDPTITTMNRLRASGIRGTWMSANDAAYSADGRFVAVAAEGSDAFFNTIDSAVLVWNGAKPELPITILHPMDSFALALSPDGRLLYVGTEEPALAVIDVGSGRIVNSVPLPAAITVRTPPPDTGSNIWSGLSDDLEVSPDGKTLAVSLGNDIMMYDAATLIERGLLRGHHDLVRSLQFSHDGRLLAAGSDDHTAVVWDLATSTAIDTLTGHAGAVLGLAFSPDDGTLYTGGLDSHVLVWDLSGRRQFVARILDPAPSDAHIGRAVASSDGHSVAYVGAAASGGNLQFADVVTGHLDARVIDPGADPLAAWLPPDDRQVVTVAGPILRVRDRRNSQTVAERTVATSDITALAATSDGRFVVIGDHAGGVGRIETGGLQDAGPRVQLGHLVSAIAVGPGDTAVALLDDNTYADVDLAQGSVLRRGSLGFRPYAAAVSPDGRRLAIGGAFGEVGLLDLDSQEWIAAPTVSHRQFVVGVAFSADGHTLVTSSFDGSVRLWDGDSGGLVAGVQVGRPQSSGIPTIPPSGQNAIFATRDGAAYRLDTRFGQWAAFACSIAGRNLTAHEWQVDFGDRPYRETCPTG